MMKVSDPIIFGHAVRAYFADVFAEHGDALARVGANPNDGLGERPHRDRDAARRRARGDRGRDRRRPTRPGPTLAMVDSDRGITNLHVPSDVIIDASMPAMIRTSGQMWNAAGEQQDTKAVIPDSQLRGAVRRDDRLLPRARRVRPGDDGHDAERRPDGAEGRGVRLARQDVRDRRAPARVRVVDGVGRRRCSSTRSRPATSGAPARPRTRRSRDWVRLAVERARATGAPAVFWLDETRAHDARDAREGPARTCPSTTPTGCRSRSCRSPRRRASRSSAPRAARTRSRSPATSCATTSPTCSRSSSSARARRCSRSCR